jgi:hypothetical protein
MDTLKKGDMVRININSLMFEEEGTIIRVNPKTITVSVKDDVCGNVIMKVAKKHITHVGV